MQTINLTNPSSHCMAAELQLTSNGEGAKTAKVTVVARSGEPVYIDNWGMVVHDFAGMTSKPRIPLDYNHDCEDSIGYLNRFDSSSGDLVCSGVIVLVNGAEDGDVDDDVNALVAKMSAGIPYEASIEFGEDCLLEFVPDGFVTSVNGQEFSGPVTVVREWELKAVAVCKFGVDSNTSTVVQMSEKKEDSKKGFFLRLSKSKKGKIQMTENKVEKDQAAEVVATAVEVPVAEAKAVEATVAEADQVQLSEVKAEVEAQAVEAVEAKKDEENEVAAVAVEASVHLSASKSDDRSEFKQFVTTFGAEKAAIYFSEGMSFTDSLAKFAGEVQKENAELKQRLSSVDRGAAKPIKLSAEPERSVKGGMEAVIKMASKTK